MIQLESYICIHVSGERQTGFEKNTSFMSRGTMVHMIFLYNTMEATGIRQGIVIISSPEP